MARFRIPPRKVVKPVSRRLTVEVSPTDWPDLLRKIFMTAELYRSDPKTWATLAMANGIDNLIYRHQREITLWWESTHGKRAKKPELQVMAAEYFDV
jgi:hypothetical protein